SALRDLGADALLLRAPPAPPGAPALRRRLRGAGGLAGRGRLPLPAPAPALRLGLLAGVGVGVQIGDRVLDLLDRGVEVLVDHLDAVALDPEALADADPGD